ncbi:MAG: hypothetical protein OHK0038_13860 [Flammeovirgaceae bacterium]
MTLLQFSKKKLSLTFAAVGFMGLSYVSCTHEPNIEALPEVCFEKEVLPIFQTNCAISGCHDATSKEEGYDFSTYESIISKGIEKGNASKSKVYKAMTTTTGEIMPPSGALPEAQRQLILVWIEQGAKNTTCP